MLNVIVPSVLAPQKVVGGVIAKQRNASDEASTTNGENLGNQTEFKRTFLKFCLIKLLKIAILFMKAHLRV
jgi:hypothetical protein